MAIQTIWAARMRFNHNGRLLFHACPDAVRVWDVENQALHAACAGDYAGISRDERVLLTLDGGGSLCAWDLRSGARLDESAVDWRWFEPSQRMQVKAGARGITLTDLFGQEAPRKIALIDQVEEHPGLLRALDAPYAAWVAGWDIAGQEGTVGACIHLERGEKTECWYPTPPQPARRLSFSARQNTLTITYAHDHVLVCDLVTGEQIGKVMVDGCCAAHSPARRSTLAVAAPDAVLLVDMASRQVAARLPVSGQAKEIAFHPGGRKIACRYAHPDAFEIIDLPAGAVS